MESVPQAKSQDAGSVLSAHPGNMKSEDEFIGMIKRWRYERTFASLRGQIGIIEATQAGA